MKFTFHIILFFATIVSCTKKLEKDITPPIVSITSPANGTTYLSGDVILITGSVTDNEFIAEAHIHVTNINTGALLMDVHLYPSASTANYNQSIVASSGFNYRIRVIAKDRDLNETMSFVDVSCP